MNKNKSSRALTKVLQHTYRSNVGFISRSPPEGRHEAGAQRPSENGYCLPTLKSHGDFKSRKS